jgi:putative heme-binding domain-containing protein
VLEEWMPLTEQEGSVAQGKAIFTKHCSLCHQHSGEGQAIGPDLTGMAVHPKHELLTHILDPNRSVEGNFRTYTVLTGDGLVLTGMLAGESKTSIELINTQGKRETLQREEIEKITASSKSLMPEGFEGQMKPARGSMFLCLSGRWLPPSAPKGCFTTVMTVPIGCGLTTGSRRSSRESLLSLSIRRASRYPTSSF